MFISKPEVTNKSKRKGGGSKSLVLIRLSYLPSAGRDLIEILPNLTYLKYDYMFLFIPNCRHASFLVGRINPD